VTAPSASVTEIVDAAGVGVGVGVGVGIGAGVGVGTGLAGRGLVDVPDPALHAWPVQDHQRFEEFSCQIVPFTSAISVTLALWPAAEPFSSTTPALVIVQALPAESMIEEVEPAKTTASSGDGTGVGAGVGTGVGVGVGDGAGVGVGVWAGSGLVWVPSPMFQPEPSQPHQPPAAFSCQTVPPTKASSVTLAL
jgi:hypothetical protein